MAEVDYRVCRHERAYIPPKPIADWVGREPCPDCGERLCNGRRDDGSQLTHRESRERYAARQARDAEIARATEAALRAGISGEAICAALEALHAPTGTREPALPDAVAMLRSLARLVYREPARAIARDLNEIADRLAAASLPSGNSERPVDRCDAEVRAIVYEAHQARAPVEVWSRRGGTSTGPVVEITDSYITQDTALGVRSSTPWLFIAKVHLAASLSQNGLREALRAEVVDGGICEEIADMAAALATVAARGGSRSEIRDLSARMGSVRHAARVRIFTALAAPPAGKTGDGRELREWTISNGNAPDYFWIDGPPTPDTAPGIRVREIPSEGARNDG
jgi:hypothetical protein